MNTPWILDEVESEFVANWMLMSLKALHEADKCPETRKSFELLLAQYCGPRKLSIDYKEWKFVRFI